ncbi:MULTISPECIES: hypothetical protein [unclassified Spirosoma]|uniref:hypothetical protein n=1 Tax=unclassified Spirosoma TaxID=2621999 RepID=UPI00095C8AFE|nr:MULTISPECIES: hypothetical protein [unclassified Spirosoma]MBN8821320.1 hypothetical protein [Spirosoma sp.]OJW78109.1 MAG: hypothetical protein BGO59_29255 [Spirosoma sp. 48-14]
MKNTFTFLLVIPLLLNCEPSKEQLCSKMDDSIRKHYEDMAFKANIPLKIFDIKTVDFKMVGQDKVDSLTHDRYSNMMNAFHQAFLATNEVAKSKIELMKLGGEINGKASEYDKNRVDESLAKLKELSDSVNYYVRLDSLLEIKMKARKDDPKIYYFSKTFTKLTADNKNTLDTLYYVLNKDFKIITH